MSEDSERPVMWDPITGCSWRLKTGRAEKEKEPMDMSSHELAIIRAKVEAIQGMKWDNEVAHGLQDELLVSTLKAIAGGAENPAALAQAALEVMSIEFDRWYA